MFSSSVLLYTVVIVIMNTWENSAGWTNNQADSKREGIRDGVAASGQELVRYVLDRIEPLDVRGEPVYECDWDVLILLDGCRLDLLESVSDEYGFVPESIPPFRSLASTSNMWMERNFTDEYSSEVRNTCYVTRIHSRMAISMKLDSMKSTKFGKTHGMTN
jgi:hypothetical protein